MRLGVRMLNNSTTLNQLKYANQVQVNPGETQTVYFQLIDLDQPGPCPQRYIPASGATMSVSIPSISTTNSLTKIPTNPFADDRSIWSFNLSATETNAMAGVNMKVTLTEGANIKIANADAVLVVGPKSSYSC